MAGLLSAASLRADPEVDAVMARARESRQNSAAIVANAALDHPKSLLPLVTASMTELPAQAAEILKLLLKVQPKQAAAIVRAAVLAQPELAKEIAAVAIATLPDQADALLQAAVDAAPEAARIEIAALKDNPPGTTGQSLKSPGFPVQPIRPDLISPSS